MPRCPKCNKPRDSRICPWCQDRKQTPEERGTFLTGETVQHQGERYVIVREGKQGRDADGKPDGVRRWWLRNAEGRLVCVDEYAIAKPEAPELKAVEAG